MLPAQPERDWARAGWAVAAVLIATLPFLGKPLHIDDPADLAYARQVLREPGDPYGFLLDWDEGPAPAFRNYHPPLKYYFQALVLLVLPCSAVVLHAATIPLVAATAWALVRIGRRFDCPPQLAVLWLLGPGYLPGQNAMLDVPTMALALVGTALVIEGTDRDRMGTLTAAGIALAAALLTKYAALVYVPVWALYLLLRGRARHWVALAIPAVVLVLWGALSAAAYGSAHPRVLFASGVSLPAARSLASRLLSAAVFLGGAMPGAWVVLAARGRARRVILGGSIAAALTVAVLSPPLRRVTAEPPELTPINLGWWGALAATGIALGAWSLAAPILAARSETPGARDELFLSGWFWSALVIGSFGAPFLAMRRVVEAALPAWVLLLRRGGVGARACSVACWGAVVVNTALGLAVAAADYEWALVYPRFARELAAIGPAATGRVWCYGYWGWSYYTERAGLPRYVLDGDPPPHGGLLVIPEEAAKPARLPPELAHELRRAYDRPFPQRIPIRLMHYQAGAGYYAAAWGPLPYAWSFLPCEVFHFYERVRTADEPDETR